MQQLEVSLSYMKPCSNKRTKEPFLYMLTMEGGREGGNKGHLPFSFKQTSTIVLYFQILHLEKKSAKEKEAF